MQANSNPWRAFSGICLLALMAFLDFTIVNTALPVIQRVLHASIIELQWVMNIYFLVLAIFMVVAGKLGDIFGHRRIYYLGCTLFALASLAASVATTPGILIAARFFQALGASIIYPGAAALLVHVFSAKDSAKALGLYGAIGGAGLAIGPVLGALLTTYLSWRAIFFVNIPIYLIGMLILAPILPETSRQRNIKIDWAGLISYALGIGGIVFGIVQGAGEGWQAPITLGSLLVGVLALIAFWRIELKVTAPLIDLRLFKIPLYFAGAMGCMMSGIVSAVLLFFMPLYLHTISHLSPLVIGIVLFTMTLVFTIVSSFVGKLVQRFGTLNTLFIGLIAALLTAFFSWLVSDASFSPWYLILPLAVAGAAWAIGNIVSAVAANESVTKEKIGMATGIIYMLFDVGGAVMLAVTVLIFKTIEKSHLLNFFQATHQTLSSEQVAEIERAVANPDTSGQLLSFFNPEIFHQAFIAGTKGAYLALTILSIGILCLTYFVTRTVISKQEK